MGEQTVTEKRNGLFYVVVVCVMSGSWVAVLGNSICFPRMPSFPPMPTGPKLPEEFAPGRYRVLHRNTTVGPNARVGEVPPHRVRG